MGGLDEASRAKVVALYGKYLGAPIEDVGTIEAAEMTKLLGMLYRDVNIALANELAGYCEAAGVDFERIRAAANSDGEADLLLPGIGVGGHCTPVYPYFLTRASRRLGLTQRISEAAREINDLQPSRQLARVAAAWKPLDGQRVHLLGLGFRPGVKVDTFSPAYALRDELSKRGARVTIEDPYYTDEELRSAGFAPGTAESAQLVVLNTAHREFAHPDFAAWRKAGRGSRARRSQPLGALQGRVVRAPLLRDRSIVGPRAATRIPLAGRSVARFLRRGSVPSRGGVEQARHESRVDLLVLAPSVSLPEALGRLLGKSRPPAGIPVQADNGTGKRGDVLGFEELHHLLVEIARDRAGSWRHARNSHADVLEQLGGQHDVGATADAQRNQPDVGVLDQVRDALDRHEAFTERDDVAQIESVPQLDQRGSVPRRPR